MYRKKFVRRPRRKIIRRRRGLAKKSVPLRFKRYVKRVVHSNIENRKRIDYAANNAIVVNTPSTQMRPLLPAIGQGTSEIDRTGNQAKIVKGCLDLTINLLPFNASNNSYPLPCWVKVWVVRDLGLTSQQSTYTTNISKLFTGNGTSLGFQNNTLDMTLPVNKDQFRVLYEKTFKLGCSSVYVGGTPVTGASYFDNSPMAKHLKIYWNKWCKKQLKFDDNVNPFYPINENLYYIIQAIPCNGSSVTSGDALIEQHYVNYIEFEDA